MPGASGKRQPRWVSVGLVTNDSNHGFRPPVADCRCEGPAQLLSSTRLGEASYQWGCPKTLAAPTCVSCQVNGGGDDSCGAHRYTASKAIDATEPLPTGHCAQKLSTQRSWHSNGRRLPSWRPAL